MNSKNVHFLSCSSRCGTGKIHFMPILCNQTILYIGNLWKEMLIEVSYQSNCRLMGKRRPEALLLFAFRNITGKCEIAKKRHPSPKFLQKLNEIPAQ